MFITEHADGSVTWTGSFHRAEWDEFLASKGLDPSDTSTVPLGLGPQGDDLEPAPQTAPKVEEPAGNASADDWRAYALSQGASPEEVADLSRNDLRDTYGSKEEE